MLRQTSEEFKAFFLLEFTRKLIEHSAPKEVLELKEVLKEETKGIRRKRGRIQQLKPLVKPLSRPESLTTKSKRVLKIPKTKLPSHLQYLKPSSTKDTQMELGKLDSLIKDPLVTDIECSGPNEVVTVKTTTGTKKTNIVLTKEEINDVIKKFSEAAKIPVHEGLFKVVVGRMIFSAVISNITDSRFIIKKMTYNPGFQK